MVVYAFLATGCCCTGLCDPAYCVGAYCGVLGATTVSVCTVFFLELAAYL